MEGLGSGVRVGRGGQVAVEIYVREIRLLLRSVSRWSDASWNPCQGDQDSVEIYVREIRLLLRSISGRPGSCWDLCQGDQDSVEIYVREIRILLRSMSGRSASCWDLCQGDQASVEKSVSGRSGFCWRSCEGIQVVRVGVHQTYHRYGVLVDVHVMEIWLFQSINQHPERTQRGEDGSVGRASDWKTRRNIDADSSPRCGKGFFTSQLPVQTLLRCPYSPRVQSQTPTSVHTKIPDSGSQIGTTKILHTLVGMGSAALVATLPYPNLPHGEWSPGIKQKDVESPAWGNEVLE